MSAETLTSLSLGLTQKTNTNMISTDPNPKINERDHTWRTSKGQNGCVNTTKYTMDPQSPHTTPSSPSIPFSLPIILGHHQRSHFNPNDTIDPRDFHLSLSFHSLEVERRSPQDFNTLCPWQNFSLSILFFSTHFFSNSENCQKERPPTHLKPNEVNLFVLLNTFWILCILGTYFNFTISECHQYQSASWFYCPHPRTKPVISRTAVYFDTVCKTNPITEKWNKRGEVSTWDFEPRSAYYAAILCNRSQTNSDNM